MITRTLSTNKHTRDQPLNNKVTSRVRMYEAHRTPDQPLNLASLYTSITLLPSCIYEYERSNIIHAIFTQKNSLNSSHTTAKLFKSEL